MSLTWPEGSMPQAAFPNSTYAGVEMPRHQQLDFADLGARYEDFRHDPDGMLRFIKGIIHYSSDTEVDVAAAIPSQPELSAAEESEPKKSAPELTIDQMRLHLLMNAVTQEPTTDRDEVWNKLAAKPDHIIVALYRAYRATFPALGE